MNKRHGFELKLCLMALPLLFLTNASALAEAPQSEAKIADMVVTATRSKEDVNKLPTKIEVIDGQTIELTIGETLTEQLKKNSSVGVIEYPGTLAGIGIRGFRPEYSGITKHTLVLVDGRPAGATNLATILSCDIERVEVLKGPASSLYGAEAMGGVVNIIRKKHTDELTGQAEIGVGSFDTNFQKAAIGGGISERLDFDFFARRYDQTDDITMGNGESREHTSYLTQNGFLRLGADLSDAWRLDVSGELYQGRDIETPGDTFDGDEKSGRKDIDRQGLDLSLQGDLSANDRLSLTVYQATEISELYKRYTDSSDVQVPPYHYYDSETGWLGLQLKNAYTWAGHRFITGFDYQKIDVDTRKYSEDGTRLAPYSPDEARENRAVYLETVWRFMDNHLTATVGGRYDTFDVETKSTPYKSDFTPNTESFDTFSPRAGLNYLSDEGLRLHTTIGQAFVPPTATQLAVYSEKEIDGVTMITQGNADLDPETSLTYDAGVGFESPQSGLSFDLTYFHTDVDDQITRVTRGYTTTYENTLTAEMEGVETTFSFDIGALLNWNRSLALFINATHILKAEEEQDDGTMKDIHNVADYTINYGLQYDDGRLTGKLHCRNQGEMKDTDWNAAGYPELTYPTFTVVDLSLGFKFLHHHHLDLKVDNLLDENYYEKKGYPKPGRAFYLSYKYAF